MVRHVLILARNWSAASGAVTIALDRHLSRGEPVEIMLDRRGEAPEPSADRRQNRPDRRRPNPLSEHLRAQGYALISREESVVEPPATPAPAHTPAPDRAVRAAAPAQPVAPAPVPTPGAPVPAGARFFEHSPAARADRPRLSLDDRQALKEEVPEDWATGVNVRDVDGPSRRGGLVAVLVLLIAALAAGLFFFSTEARDRVTRLLNPTAPSSETATTAETATPADSATSRESAAEEPTRAASSAPDPAPATPAPSVRAPETAAPVMPAPAAPSAAPPSPAAREAAPAESTAPGPSAPPSLPPRRAEPPTADRVPDAAPQQATRSQRLPEFPGLPRVEVSRAAGADGTTFTVRLTDPRGRPLPDAQVWLRQKSTDGFVRETPLEPVSPAGSYRGAVPGAAKRADVLTVRVVLGDRRMEMPVAE